MSDLFNEIIILEALCLREDAHNSLFCLGSFLFKYIMTKEERAVYMKAYNKAYKEANKEKLKAKRKANKENRSEAQIEADLEANRAYMKAYYQKNKDKAKARYEANKEDILAKRPIYRKNTKEKRATQAKVYSESKKLSYNIVYCIPNYNGKGDNYCGVTNQPEARMRVHNTLGVLNTSEWYELGICNDRKEARDLEDAFHKLGYHGAYGYKNKAA